MLAPKDSKLDGVSPCYFLEKGEKKDVKEILQNSTEVLAPPILS